MGNRIIAITGPSGSGKTTLGTRLAEVFHYAIPKHSTTRQERKDDPKGFYRYLTHEEYKRLYEQQGFLISSGDGKEIKKEYGNFYGVLKKDCVNAYKESDTLILFVSYKDIYQLVDLKHAGFQIDIINLTFTNIEKGVRMRLIGNKERNHSLNDINSRIKNAMLDAQNYQKALENYANVTLYTDILNCEETYQEVCKQLLLKK